MSFRDVVRQCCAYVLALSVVGTAGGAFAESAADKATARQLATQGIKLYDGGDYAAALDNLQRAQSLYDAPVHLLYIARTQVKLGRVVEGSETYRRLIRAELDSAAPPAFRDAVDAAKKELPGVEASVPALRIHVRPAGADARVEIDGELVPAAALGVNRPSNPGEHRIVASATGYAPAEARVTLRPAETKEVVLALRAVAGKGGSRPPQSVDTDARVSGKASPPSATTASRTTQDSGFSFLLGLRLGGLVPTGSLTTNVPMSDAFGGGAAIGVLGGVRFAKYFAGFLTLDGGALKPGPAYDLQVRRGEKQVDNTASTTDAGLGVRVGSVARRFGGFGQLEILPLHRIQVNSDRQLLTGSRCSATLAYSGGAIRVGGGLTIPVLSWLQLTPAAHATVGRMSTLEVGGDCAEAAEPGRRAAGSGDLDEAATHTVLFFGMAGEWLFGGAKPAE
jgi:hypothetical protein